MVDNQNKHPDLADGQLQRDLHRGILLLTLNRPEKANALSSPILEGIIEAFEAAKEDQEIKAILITGSGDRVFSGGADLREMEAAEKDPETAEKYFSLWENTVNTMMEFPLPTIALVNGACVAGGLSLALACDIRIATENAFLSYPRVADGHLPGRHNLTRLVHLVGRSQASLVMLCGYRVNAGEAHQWGLVDTVLDMRNDIDALDAILEPLIESDRKLLSSAKHLIRNADEEAAWEQVKT